MLGPHVYVRIAAAGLIAIILMRRHIKQKVEENREACELHVITGNPYPPAPKRWPKSCVHAKTPTVLHPEGMHHVFAAL